MSFQVGDTGYWVSRSFNAALPGPLLTVVKAGKNQVVLSDGSKCTQQGWKWGSGAYSYNHFRKATAEERQSDYDQIIQDNRRRLLYADWKTLCPKGSTLPKSDEDYDFIESRVTEIRQRFAASPTPTEEGK